MKLKGLMKGLLPLALATALTAVPVYAQEDNTLTIGVSASFDKLDPTLSSNYPAYYLSEAIFEPLFHWNQLKREFEPRVALSYSVNETYDVWTFVLRQGVKFSDGSELTADDVAFTFNRIRDPETKSSSRSSFASISEIVVVDKYTLEVHTAAPDPYLLRNVSSSSGVIVSRAFYEGKSAQELSEQPMGSGPYKLGDWQKGQAMTLVPNENYWGNAAPIANVVMVPIPEVGTRVSALLTGEVDLIDDVQLEDIERIEADPAKQIVEIKDGFVQWLYFDTTRPPFDDIEMRKAFVHAIDLEGTLDALLGERYTLLTAPISPNMVEYNDDLVAHAYDPDLSQQILASKGGPVALNTFTSNGRYVKDADIYAAINDQVSSVGFNVNPQVLEWGTLIGNMIKGEAGPFALIGAGYDDGNVSRLYPRLTGMASWKPGAEFEELYRQVSLETDHDKATALWQQMLAVIHDNYLIAGTWQVSTIRAADKRLSFAPSYSTYMLLTDISWSAN